MYILLEEKPYIDSQWEARVSRGFFFTRAVYSLFNGLAPHPYALASIRAFPLHFLVIRK